MSENLITFVLFLRKIEIYYLNNVPFQVLKLHIDASMIAIHNRMSIMHFEVRSAKRYHFLIH